VTSVNRNCVPLYNYMKGLSRAFVQTHINLTAQGWTMGRWTVQGAVSEGEKIKPSLFSAPVQNKGWA
jgi:hypothetical protein